MYEIVESHAISDTIYEMWIRAPQVAHNAKSGQFCIIHINQSSERIPLTISDIDGDMIRIYFMTVGTTTKRLSTLSSGDFIRDVVGPLGIPSEIDSGSKTVVIVGGGIGIACTPIIAKTAKSLGNYVIGIIGARNKDLIILEDEMRNLCDELFVTTDDGSYGIKGYVGDQLKKLCDSGRCIDKVWIIGSTMMMKVTSEVTRSYGIKTYASLNPIMVDGTGMCGSCRVIVDGNMKFACVDGPEFDAHKVDWTDLLLRQRMYLYEEKQSLECYCMGVK